MHTLSGMNYFQTALESIIEMRVFNSHVTHKNLTIEYDHLYQEIIKDIITHVY